MSRTRELLGSIGRDRRKDEDDDVLAARPRPSPTKLTTEDLAASELDDRDQIEPGKLTQHDVGTGPSSFAEVLAWARSAGGTDLDGLDAAFVDGPRAPAPRDTRPARLTDARAALARLATCDAIAARTIFLALAEREAPWAIGDAYASSLPAHVAGPALGLPSNTNVPAPRGRSPFTAVTERVGAAIYRDSHADHGSEDHPLVRDALARRGGGQPLPAALRAEMEARFGASFARVRIHADAAAAAACGAIGANAFTIGEDIFFGADRYAGAGDALLAHELTHVVQAQQGRTATAGLSRPDDALEHEARATGARVATGGAAGLDATPDAAPTASASAMMLRDDKKEIVTLAQDWLKAAPFSKGAGGKLTSVVGTESIRILGPAFTVSSAVSLKLPDDRTLGSQHIKVGPIQTLLSSNRIGVYQKDGRTIEQARTMSEGRDAAEGQNEVGGTPFAPVEPPFYSGNPAAGQDAPNSKLHDWTGTGADFSDTVTLSDQPKMSLAKKLPTGETLVAVKGADTFNTSAGFKSTTGEIIGLAPFGWSVSWDTPIAADGTATPDPARDAVTRQPATEAIIHNTEDYVNLMARQEFRSLDEAMLEPGWALLEMLPKVRARNATAAGFIQQALAAKNPQIKVTVTATQGVGQKSAVSGSEVGDDVTMSVHATITKSSGGKSTTARAGTGGSVQFGLNEMADPAAINDGVILNITVNEDGHLGGGTEFPFPFRGGQTQVVGQNDGSEGTYRVTYTRI